jgi:hypothetical protein
MSIQIFDIKKTAQELEQLVTDVVARQGLFVPVGRDMIRYKKYVIKRDQLGRWNVFSTEPRKRYIANTFLKVSAFAVCKLDEKRLTNKLDEVLKTDQDFSKHYIDSLHFKNTIKISKDTARQDIAQWRYEIAHDRAREAKQFIDRVFYSSIV